LENRVSRGPKNKRRNELPAEPRHPTIAPPLGLQATRFRVGGEELVAFSVPKRALAIPEQLSAAEREVAELMLSGLSNAEIAAFRGTALRTVANQVAVIFDKVGVGSRGELVARLIADGTAPAGARRKRRPRG
jgi:DNA-binding CsgD family transcriptional regulator